MKKYPSILQQEAKDCGVACLLSIIKYYDGYVSLERLRELSHTNREGVSAYDLIECAKIIGFDSEGIKCRIEDILDNKILLPVIAHVTIDNKYNHYIVIYEINKKYLIIHDPMIGIKKIKISEFLEIWNNIVITLVPNKSLPIEKNNLDMISVTLRLFRYYKKEFIELVILSLFGTVFGIIVTFYLQHMIDSVNNLKPFLYLMFVFIFYLVITLFKIITNYFRNEVFILVNNKIDLLLTNGTFYKLVLLPYRYYHTRTTGDVVSRINDLAVVKDNISRLFVTIFIDISLMVGSLIIMFIISYELTFYVLLIFFMYLILWFLFRKNFERKIYLLQNKKAGVSSHMVESLSGFQTIQGLSLQKMIIKKFNILNYDFVNNKYRFEHLFNLEVLLKEGISELGSLILIFLGILLVNKNALSLTSLITYNMLFAYFINPVKNFIDLDIGLKESKQALKRILDLYEVDKEMQQFSLVSGNIIFNNLYFSYKNKKVLKNINLTIEKEVNTVITGTSGSGKSTLFKLLIRYYQVKRGMISIGNVDINDIAIDSIRNYILYVSQNETLFTDTIYNNIVLDRCISEDDFLKVVRVCQIEEIVRKSNLGYQMLIEENGFNLSGGEKQRVFLARCLLSDAEFIIIDEAMSALDISMERQILKSIKKEYNKTIIMITHRIDNVDLFDRKIEINGGYIKDDVRKCLLYRE